MGRRLKLLLLTQCLWAAWLAGVHADGAQTSVESEQLASPTALVRQLGDPRFSVRKRAMEQLVELGVEAIAALEEGVQSNDREVSFRSRRALDVVREHDFQRRLRAFAAGQDAQETYELPGWAMFRNEVGDGLEARRLFVEMQQAEPQLLQALARSPDKAVEALVDRLEDRSDWQGRTFRPSTGRMCLPPRFSPVPSGKS
jgi:HEAT repeat protein